MMAMMTMIKCPKATDLCAPPIGVELKTRQHKGCGSAAIQLHGLMSHSSRGSRGSTTSGSSNHIGIFEAWQGKRQRERVRETDDICSALARSQPDGQKLNQCHRRHRRRTHPAAYLCDCPDCLTAPLDRW